MNNSFTDYLYQVFKLLWEIISGLSKRIFVIIVAISGISVVLFTVLVILLTVLLTKYSYREITIPMDNTKLMLIMKTSSDFSDIHNSFAVCQSEYFGFGNILCLIKDSDIINYRIGKDTLEIFSDGKIEYEKDGSDNGSPVIIINSAGMVPENFAGFIEFP